MAAWSEQMGNQNAKVECKTVGGRGNKIDEARRALLGAIGHTGDGGVGGVRSD